MNPLAIGISLGGLFLDLVAPRPKPRAGLAHESLRSAQAVPRTPWQSAVFDGYGGRPVAGGSSFAARVTSRD
jgi:hypothetical protein